MLCSACKKIFDDSPKTPSRVSGLLHWRLWKHHAYPYLIESASQDGCQVCRLLWEKFTPAEKDGLRAAVPGEAPILTKWSFPVLAAAITFTPWKRALLAAAVACQVVDAVVRPILGLVKPDWKLPDKLMSVFEPLHYIYRSIRFLSHGLDYENYAWRVDLAAAEYQPLTVEFMFAALNWGNIPVALIPAHDIRLSERVRLPDGTEKVFYLKDRLPDEPIPLDMCNQNWGLIWRWIGHCNAGDPRHRLCHTPPILGSPMPPSRLLDVSAGPDRQLIQLVLTEDYYENLEYVTLSYCWGDNTNRDDLPLLREESIVSYCKEVPFDTLPRLFKDAIEVTRKLNIRYLWIDSLCIIQNSTNDMEKELLNMGNIYLGGTLNIAAGGSPNVHSPLVCQRDPSFVEPLQVDIKWKNLARKQKYRGIQKFYEGSHIVVDGHFLAANTQDCALGRRAWVMQEQYLAPRTLHFGMHQLFWQCRQGHACETWPRGMPNLNPFLGYQGATFGIMISAFDRNVSGIDMSMQWWLLVELYSRRELTFSRDRLLAVSALARLFADRAFPDDDYVAGMWVQQLPHSLCWGPHFGAGTVDRPPSRIRYQNVAPSWSWASFDGHILPPVPRHYFDTNGIDIWPFTVAACNGIDVNYSDGTAVPFGGVNWCRLKLSTGIVRSKHLLWLDRTRMGWQNTKKYQALYGAALDSSFLGVVRTPTFFFQCIFDVPEVEEANKTPFSPSICRYPGIDLLPIRTWRTSAELYSTDGFTEGIAVRQTQTGTYRRIGYWRTAINTHDSVFNYETTDEEEIILE